MLQISISDWETGINSCESVPDPSGITKGSCCILSSACFARILVAATVILFPLHDYSKKRAGWGQQEIPWSWGAKKGETHLEPSLSVLDETFLELELPPQLLALPRYLIHPADGGENP
jgi:hypothetical protein